MMDEVIVNGKKYRPVDEEEAARLGKLLREFTLEGSTFWRDLFIKNDTDDRTGELYGMYSAGDEERPFFTEAFLYNLLGKDEARTVLAIVRQLSELGGVKFR